MAPLSSSYLLEDLQVPVVHDPLVEVDAHGLQELLALGGVELAALVVVELHEDVAPQRDLVHGEVRPVHGVLLLPELVRVGLVEELPHELQKLLARTLR